MGFGSFFGGLLGGGGGGSSVTTSSSQKTEVTVNVDPQIGIMNEIDLEPVQQLVDHFADAQGDVGKGLQLIGAAQIQSAQNWKELKNVLLVGTAGYVIWKAAK